MTRLARRAGVALLDTHDPGLEPARGDVGAEPLGRRRRGVEADQLAPRRLERGGDAVKGVDARYLRLPPFVRTLEARRARGRRRRSSSLPPRHRSGGARRFARTM